MRTPETLAMPPMPFQPRCELSSERFAVAEVSYSATRYAIQGIGRSLPPTVESDGNQKVAKGCRYE